MNFSQCQEFIGKIFPRKKVKYEFDEKCQGQYHIGFTNGVLNLMHQVECDKVKITLDGHDPIYGPILPYKLSIPWSMVVHLLNSKQDICIEDETLDQAADDPTGQIMKNLSEFSYLSLEVIKKKVEERQAKRNKKAEEPLE